MLFGIDEQRPVQLADPRVRGIEPDFIRVRLNWPRVQPGRGQPIAWDDELLALIAKNGWKVLLCVYGENPWWPTWANENDYRAFLVQALGDLKNKGLSVAWLSPWNEPNHSAFNPNQRDKNGKPISPGWYATKIWPAALEAAHGAGVAAIAGDLAGGRARLSNASRIGIEEWVDHVGSAVLDSALWAVHDYTPKDLNAQGTSAHELATVLAKHKRRAVILVTETGALTTGMTVSQAAATYSKMMGSWHDQGVRAFCQYTLESDPGWPCGLWRGQAALPSLRAVQRRPR